MNLSDQIQSLIRSGAWIQTYAKGQPQPNIALGAAEWIDGHGLLFAEVGAEHQGHVHLIDAARLEMDGEEMVDAYDSTGGLVATVHPMSRSEHASAGVSIWLERTTSPGAVGIAWRRFWAARISDMDVNLDDNA